MAPAKKGTKREASTAAPAPKKTRVDPAVEGVLEAIRQAVDLPETVRKMLEASVPLGLCTPQNERHQVQDTVVTMIGEVVEGVRAKLQEAVDAEDAKLGGVEGRRAELQAAVAAAEEVFASASQDTDGKADAMAHAMQAVNVAMAALAEKRKAQIDGDAAMVEAETSKVALERGIEVNLGAIAEGTTDSTQHYEALMPLLQGIAVDESLLSALPSVCSKSASERGAFDNMVLEQLGQTLRDRVATLAKLVEEAVLAARERETAALAAQTMVDEASAAQGEATEALNIANLALQAAQQERRIVKEALAAFEPEYRDTTCARDECVQKLGRFKEYNISAFELLRNKVTAGSATAGGA